MIRLDRVELLHWDVQPHQSLPLARGVTLLTGENGSGKTSILDGLKVALGASRLEGDRSVEEYLSRQARPVAMIRVLADNRPAPGTRRRPFDRLGDLSDDLVSLAVVFRAEEEGRYRRDYYILDGDRIPPLEPGRRTPAPLASAADYRARLARVGITARYLKLLTLPQGQIAGLCRNDPAALFDDLYDIIGGRQALDAWEKRLAELKDAQRRQAQVADELARARDRLSALASRAARHEDWRRAVARVEAHRAAAPHLELREARARVETLTSTIERADAAARRHDDEIRLASEASAEASGTVRATADARATLAERIAALRDERDAAMRAEVKATARWGQLDELRMAADGIEAEDAGHLAAEDERLRTALAKLGADREALAGERAQVQADLARVNDGILPWPDEVERFRGRLRSEGIAHHLLAELLDVREDRWRAAVEGYLGRFRFAVAVPDPASWARAARLAREQAYPHGVLAPDVRGHSPADADSLLGIVEVHDPDYRPLVARLLRPVIAGEPPDPLEPVRRGEMLAADGFIVSRVEARRAVAETHFLGRDALEKRKRQLGARLDELVRLETDRAAQEGDVRRVLGDVLRRQAAQRALGAWEAVRDEHERVAVDKVRHAGEVARLAAEIARASEEDKRREREGTDAEKRQEAAAGKAQAAEEAARQRRAEAEAASVELENAQVDLARLLGEPPAPPSEATTDVLAEVGSAGTLKALLRALEQQLSGYDEADRDTLLPLNFERQRGEVGAVEERLQQLDAALAETRAAAESAREEYQQATRRVFRAYFARLRQDAKELDFTVDGELVPADNGRFRCEVRVGVGEKAPVHYGSGELSGGQKAAVSILMAMTAVSLESDGAGFFLVDEPFSASDVYKINELGSFLDRTGAQYLVSMPTSSDLEQCGPWLSAVWTCTKTRGGYDEARRPVLAPLVKLSFAPGARDA